MQQRHAERAKQWSRKVVDPNVKEEKRLSEQFGKELEEFFLEEQRKMTSCTLLTKTKKIWKKENMQKQKASKNHRRRQEHERAHSHVNTL